MSGSNWVTPGDIPNFGWNGPRLGWPELILPRRGRGAARKKTFPFSPGINLGGFGMVKNIGKGGLEFLGHWGPR